MNSFTDHNESLNIWPSFADIAFCAMVVFLIYALYLMSVPQNVKVGNIDAKTADFASGSAKLPQAAYASLDSLHDKIVRGEYSPMWEGDSTYIIVVAGHTDNVPFYDEKLINNWGLSSARAQSVVNYFVDIKGIDPKRIRAIGYGENKPKTSNATEEGRAKNRRIEVFLMKSGGKI